MPTVGSVAWYPIGQDGHVAYVDAVNGSQVHVVADDFPPLHTNTGYTYSKWVSASSVPYFLHP